MSKQLSCYSKVFEEIGKMKLESIIKENNQSLVEKCTQSLKKNVFKEYDENEKEKKDDNTFSFCSDKSSRENSMSDSPIKETENEDIDFFKNTDFLLRDLNLELDLLSN